MPKPTAARATVENEAVPERPDTVTAIEAAARLGLNERTIRRAIERGDLPAVRRGRGFAIELHALEAYRLRHAPTAPPVPLTMTAMAEVADLEPGFGLLAEPTVLVAEAPLLGGLPTPLTSFVGREREAAELAALLGAGERLVTLTGLGGVGKSRLALAVATDFTPRFADGAAFVALAPVRAVDRVLPTILLALGEREADDRLPLERLTGLLRQRQLLLLLDNLEHVLDVGPDLADLLTACPRLTILATSRSALRVTGERRFPVPPLSLPDATAGGAGVAAVGTSEAVRLFVDRAQAADGAFALTDTNAVAVVEICHRLDGLPLAIELAAARSAVLPPPVLLTRLEQRLPLLSGGPRDQPDRLRTMRGAIAWSEDLLDPEQQALLRRLAVFVGGIPLAAAEYVGGVGFALGGDASLRGERGEDAGTPPVVSSSSPLRPAGPTPPQVANPPSPPKARPSPPQRSGSPSSVSVLDGLAGLLEGGLLLRDEAASGGPRFGMLETVREYALDRLAAAGEETPPSGGDSSPWQGEARERAQGPGGETAARRAHAAWYLAFVEDAQAALWAATDETLLERIETEHDNLRAALGWAIAAEPETALRLAGGLAQFWIKRSYWSEGRSWLERSLAAASVGDSEARAVALGRAGAIATDQGDFDVAMERLDASLAMASRLGLDPVGARARRALGIVASHRSEFAPAIEHFEAALAMFRALGDQAGIARCLNDLGLVASRQGDLSRAIASYEEALPINRSLGDAWQLCIVLGNLGGAHYDHGNFARGEALTEEALAIAERLGDTFGVAVSRYNLGCFALRDGDAAAAAGRFRDVLALTQVLGERHLVSRVIDRVGAALHLDRKPRLAARLFGAAAALRESLGDALFAEEDADLSARFSAVRAELGEAAYSAALEMGRSLPYEVAVAEAARLAATLAATSPTTSDLGLTPRETEVLRLMAEGRSDKEIADALFVARSTASKHVAAVIGKLGADSRTAAVSAAHRHRLV